MTGKTPLEALQNIRALLVERRDHHIVQVDTDAIRAKNLALLDDGNFQNIFAYQQKIEAIDAIMEDKASD